MRSIELTGNNIASALVEKLGPLPGGFQTKSWCGGKFWLGSALLAGTLLLGIASFAPAAQAAQPAEQDGNFYLAGKITEQSPGKLTITSDQPKIIFHVSYDSKTAIYLSDGAAGSPKGLKVGVWIEVQGERDSAGVVQASRIELLTFLTSVVPGKTTDSSS